MFGPPPTNTATWGLHEATLQAPCFPLGGAPTVSVTDCTLPQSPPEASRTSGIGMYRASSCKPRIWPFTNTATGGGGGGCTRLRYRHHASLSGAPLGGRDPPHVAAVSLRAQPCACIRTCVASSLTTQFAAVVHCASAAPAAADMIVASKKNKK